MTMDRRSFLAALAALAGAPAFARGELVQSQAPFSRDWLNQEAGRLAAAPYQPAPSVPKGWKNLSYDEYRMIWFNSQKAIWADEPRPLQLDLFAAGLYFDHPVEIAIVDDGIARTLGFDLSLFDSTDQFPNPPVDDTMGYSGLRLRAELNKRGIFEEFMVFQGASYFRAIANGQTYGLSARGLALNTGDPSGEEFPEFRKFWVETPKAGQGTFTVHALLDGPSTSGAYSFEITPGTPTMVEVSATLYPRVALSHVGFAPLTSMFLFDETNRHRFDDFRPAVHDSEALMVWNGNDEVLWRPLANPRALQLSSFADANPKGFGLMQRGRRAEDFADLEARYENRPSLWITPKGDWGQGAVRLVEIPADREIYDNIVAYWHPGTPLAPGQAHEFAYTMAWGEQPAGLPDVAKVINTRIGRGFDQVKTVCAIDFADHPALVDGAEGLTIYLHSDQIPPSEGVLERNRGTGGLRLAFSFVPGDVPAAEFRAQLFKDNKPVSEVWLYRWTA
ncbi:glucan biosynthesis protein [Oceaniglobus ichthyenteri]|uniref:glucan biosynthesis protein n=1 Tax=Oceaniglobus ichthyenteri TaxID=2136177 RepID=UPI000D3A6D33|nr:glucan biosynthesis protein G [Oceaniglobus ichthyenteri]